LLKSSPMSAALLAGNPYNQCATATRASWTHKSEATKDCVAPQYDCYEKPQQFAAQATCMAAQSQGIGTVPLANGVSGLDRTLTVKVSSPVKSIIENPCGMCKSYELPAVDSFTFGISEDVFGTDMARGNKGEGKDTPKEDFTVKFACKAKDESYFLLLWDAFGSFGPRTDAGFLHGAWANIHCNDDLTANFNSGTTLSAYFPPANPNPKAHAYGFYLFQQTGDITLKDGKLEGFPNVKYDGTDKIGDAMKPIWATASLGTPNPTLPPSRARGGC